jgi:predicted CXXCH cytochrome family protein
MSCIRSFTLSMFLAGGLGVLSSCSSVHPDMGKDGGPPPGQAKPGDRYAPGPLVNLTGAAYVGSDKCARCGHERLHKDWAASLHNKMLQRVGPGVILGDFNDRTLEHRGWHFRMYRRDGDYYIQEILPDGSETVYRIDYTLGTKRIQHYLSVRPDKSMRVTFPTWDVLQNTWIHGSEIVRTAHNASGELIVLPIQVWNKHCWNCHTSQEEEGFDLLTDTYHTTFAEPGINCEMCHGPGSLHIERLERNPKDKVMATANAMRYPKEERMNDCLQCHTRRIMIKKGYHVGENFYDYYQLKLVDLSFRPASGPPVWADRARRFANECILLWESQCFSRGNATCVSCHDAHQVDMARDPRYKNTDVLCTQCHKEYLDRKVAAAHTRHPLESKASRCIECHMLPITKKNIKLLQNAEIRDHFINIPIPENTAKYGIPNACNNACHEDKSAEWVIEWMDKWYPRRPKSDSVEDALDLARRRSPEAVPLLLQIAQDASRSTLVRAGAISFLGEFRGEAVATALVRALGDPSVIIRAEAARSLSDVGWPPAVEPLKKQLSDPIRIARLNAVFALIKMGILSVDDSYAEAYNKTKQEYVDFLREFPTIYETRVDLGTFLAVHGKFEEALVEYKNARKLRPEAPLAHYYIGLTYAQLGLFDESLASLDEALKIDPNFRNTRDLISQVRALKERP